MRDFARYIADVVLVVVFLAALAGWIAAYWFVVGLLYIALCIATHFVKDKPNARTPPRRNT